MKSRLILLIMLLVGFFSCYEDESNKTIAVINPIVIDMAGQSVNMTGYSLELLEIQPVIYKIGTPDACLSFQWEIFTKDMPPLTIGDKMTLKTIITVPPEASPYTVRLTVIDEDTGLRKYQNFYLTVLSSLGKGLLIADTQDGVTSDLNLIMAKEFSQGSTPFEDKNTKEVRNIYSTMNGAPFQELITGMISTFDERNPNPRTVTVITDKHAYRMDPYEYMLVMKDEEMFMFPSVLEGHNFRPLFIGHADRPVNDLMILDGLVYPRNCQNGSSRYKTYMQASDGAPYYSSMGTSYLTGMYYSAVAFYDEMNNRFLRCANAYDDRDLRVMSSPSKPGPFDLNNLGGEYNPLYMGAGYVTESRHTVLAVMEEKNSRKRYLYSFFPGMNGCNENDYYAIGRYDLSAYEGFANAVAWECSPVENILYYATPDKIYSLNLSGASPIATERYQAADGEEITGLMMWRFTDQGKMWFKNPQGSAEERTLSNTGNRMMVVSTYNESAQTGKIICIPIMYVGSGTLETDKNYHVEFDGFGRILTIAHQPV